MGRKVGKEQVEKKTSNPYVRKKIKTILVIQPRTQGSHLIETAQEKRRCGDKDWWQRKAEGLGRSKARVRGEGMKGSKVVAP